MNGTCKHGIRDLVTNVPYCRRCDDDSKTTCVSEMTETRSAVLMDIQFQIKALAFDFCQREILEKARDIQYTKIHKAMLEASELTMTAMNAEVQKCLDDIKHRRETGDRPNDPRPAN